MPELQTTPVEPTAEDIPQSPIKESQTTDVASTAATTESDNVESIAASISKESKSSTDGDASSATTTELTKDSDSLLRKRKGQVVAVADFSSSFWSGAKPILEKNDERIASALVFFELQLLPMVMDLCINFLVISNRIWVKVAPWTTGENMRDFCPMMFGLGLCVFGGTFPLVIASFEAFRLVGWDGKFIMEIFKFNDWMVED